MFGSGKETLFLGVSTDLIDGIPRYKGNTSLIGASLAAYHRVSLAPNLSLISTALYEPKFFQTDMQTKEAPRKFTAHYWKGDHYLSFKNPLSTRGFYNGAFGGKLNFNQGTVALYISSFGIELSSTFQSQIARINSIGLGFSI